MAIAEAVSVQLYDIASTLESVTRPSELEAVLDSLVLHAIRTKTLGGRHFAH